MNMTVKEEYKKKIIKDLIPFAITAAVTIIILIIGAITNLADFRSIFEGVSVFESIIACILVPLIMGFEIAGFIVGWKAISNFVKAYNVLGLIIKVSIAVLLGYIIFPVILIKDIVAYCKA